jgi:mevalonate kinase
MVTASAPGKVILFGEHAVVYGEPSLAGAIDRRVIVEAEKIKGGVKISSDKSRDYRYVEKAVEVVFDYLGKSTGLKLNIRSELPPASGLGSSAAVAVATLMSVSNLLGEDLDKEKIAQLGHRVELEVQGAASPTDTITSTYGGVQYIQPKKKSYETLRAALPLVVGYTGIERSTMKLVKSVRVLRDKHPEIVDPIIRDIGRVTRTAKERIEAGEDIGELMNINNGLLEALGVGNSALSKLVHAARDAGAGGAKITGAGGGGCIVAYTPSNMRAVLRAIKECGCPALEAPISQEGAKLG